MFCGWSDGFAYLAGDTQAGADLIERGVALNPNCAEAWLAKAYVNCFACRNDAAIEALQHVTRLSPLDPFGHLVKFASPSRTCSPHATNRPSNGPTGR